MKKHNDMRDWLRGIALLLIVVAFISVSRNSRLNDPERIVNGSGAVLFLEDNITLEQLVAELDSLHVDVNVDQFLWTGKMLGWRRFPPGRYEIPRVSDADTFLSKVARGLQDPGEVTILPGITPERFAASVAADLRTDSASVRQQFEDDSVLSRETGLTGMQLFTRMLPNTYKVYWTSSPESVVRRVLSEFDEQVVNGLKLQLAASELSLEEVTTLASIVEWEARKREEKRTISGLYLNRLEKRMRLQADPTVIYALGEKRRLLFRDYQVDHPYNTYLIYGLPPSGITNPGLESIRAVLEPEDHDYLYMVATPDGSHAFSRTFREHQEKSRVWREFISEQERIKRIREREERKE